MIDHYTRGLFARCVFQADLNLRLHQGLYANLELLILKKPVRLFASVELSYLLDGFI